MVGKNKNKVIKTFLSQRVLMLPLIQKKPLENSFTQKLLIFNLVLLKPRFCLIHSEIPILKIILHAQLLGRYEKPPYLFKQ